MTTNQTIDGVPREQVERALDAIEQVGLQDKFIDYTFVRTVKQELRALMDSPAINHDQEVSDHQFYTEQLQTRAAKMLGLDPENTSWFEVVGEIEKAALPKPDQVLCNFYDVSDYPGLVRELVGHVAQLQDSGKRNVKPWEDTFPPTLLPAYIERVNAANTAAQPQGEPVAWKMIPRLSGTRSYLHDAEGSTLEEVRNLAGEYFDIQSLYAEPAAPVAVVLPDRDSLRDIIAQAIGSDTYDCLRVWSAWGVGTMSEDDFAPVVEQEERLYEIADACLDELKRLNTK